MEIKRGECFKKKTVNHCSNAMLASFFKLMVSLRVCAKSLQSCQSLCDPMDYSTPTARLLCPWRFSSQEYWSGLLSPPPGDLPNPERTRVSYVSCTGRWVPYRWHHWEDPLEKEMAIHCSILACKIPWRLRGHSPWGFPKESDMTLQLNSRFILKMNTNR